MLGYLVGRAGVLRAQDEMVLSRLAFFVATPALLFTTVATADLQSIFSPVLLTNVAGLLVVQVAYLIVAGLIWRRKKGELTIGVLASSYVNAGNLGIPVGVYVLGDGALIAPVLLFQLLVMAPIAFLILDNGPAGKRAALLLPLRNPLTVASLLGLAVALSGIDLPEQFMRPFDLVGGAAVPVALIAYGLSLSSAGQSAVNGHRRDVVLAVLLKAFVQPAVAYLIAKYALRLDGTMLLACTLFAALPTAQNIYVYSVHYDVGRRLARSAVFTSTLLSIPVMAALSALIG
ncbi:AEC family transporter [Streptosporangium sp. KLBMP 9127]|nr:AEC family transporter [Streptosporangium sp. KLBMP 9127]